MTSTYIALSIESRRISTPWTRVKTRVKEIAREFDVPLQRLRSRLADHSPASAVRGLHNRKLKPDQLALHTYQKIEWIGPTNVFQPLKHWHSEAVNEAIQTSHETFIKIEFLAAFNGFRSKAFKETTIRSAWKKSGLIPFDPNVVWDKVRETRPSARPITPSTMTESPDIWKTTPTTRKQLKRRKVSLLCSGYEPELQQKLVKFTKGGQCNDP